MVSRKFTFWLMFMLSGALAYPLAFWGWFWPLGRIIAGWYAIFVIVVVIAAALITLSIKWGPLESHHPGFLDFFTLWDDF